jgi:DNA-binding NarL/FixJ family response regulator
VSTAEVAPAEVYARLTRRQKNAMQSVRSARNEVSRVEISLADRQAEWQVRVFDALAEGVPARFIASEMHLSQSRIYQIRDEVAGHRARPRT